MRAPDHYKQFASEIGSLVDTKQSAYGDSFGRSGAVMAILYEEGITPDKMDDALAVVRILDKLFRIANARDALGESPWRDIAGYAILAANRVEEETLKRAHAEHCDCTGVPHPRLPDCPPDEVRS